MRRAFAAALLALLPPLSAAPAFAQTFAGAASEAGAAFRAPGAPLALPPAALAFSPAAPVPALSAAFAAPAAPAATLELAAAPAAAVPPAVPADAVPAAAAASPAETVVPTEPRAPIDGLRDGFSPTEGNSNTAPTVNFDGAAAAPAAPKRIAVYMDGTWDSETHRDKNGVLVPTNVQKLSRMSSDGAGQVSRYFQGVGTHPWDRWTGGLLGFGIFEQIKSAYRFVAENYRPGDEIFIFGFSRGAYAARSLAGMIVRCGVLKKENADSAMKLPPRAGAMVAEQTSAKRKIDDVDRAFAMYKYAYDPKNREAVAAFKARYSYDAGIRLLGVWDTVGSLGIPDGFLPRLLRRLRLPLTSAAFGFLDTTLDPAVRSAYQAVAVDEHRKPFLPTLWTEPAGAPPRINVPGSGVEQTWFAGAHTNIGGGVEDSGLSDVALQWMLARAVAAGLTAAGPLEPNPAGKRYDTVASFLSIEPLARRTGVGFLDALVAAANRGIVRFNAWKDRLLSVDRPIASGSWIHEGVNARLAAASVAEPYGPGPYAPSAALHVVDDGAGNRAVGPEYRVVR
jgi:uncharacterized protein (DUF2235 family)